ncbi:LLM class flavin-dependent oxidoreductase [Streptomyces griseus]|uniref:LLM class flavin-dependent oxidoreductase n=1 Tax=Streptomyces stephensoniae TaxID=3375367 RepID=A0ABU2W4U5_9ACTN|nr:LLM class flavin-dependent oxidoreductase [Streptomyces griseus]MDT0492872.1 LLM class flavin-dependent oxidoreductase [Streptomyces griseus]
MSGLRHGVVLLPEHPWARARELWARAEEFGFDHAWTYDHLSWRTLRGGPWFGTVPTLTAAATATSRIRLGTLVTGPAFRHPVTFAKELTTLDDISRGRIVCGLGAGAGGHDEEVLGAKPPSPVQRAERFEEFVELTDLLLQSPVTDYPGRYFTAVDAHTVPGCVQRPRVPFAVAATGPRGLRLAARYADIWVTAGRPGWGEPARYDRAVPRLAGQLRALEEACAAAGRDPATVRRLVVTGAMIRGVSDSASAYQDACGLFEAAGFTDVVSHWPRDGFPYQGRIEVLEDIARTVLTPGGAP